MDELDFFLEPDLNLDLPKELEQNSFEAVSCLKLDDGYAAYLMSSEATDRKLLLKRATDPIVSLGLANEKKLLDVIHRTGNELAQTFPAAGFFSTHGETSWYMRDYIRGRTLSELVEQSAGKPGLPRNQALSYVIQIAELLDFLHTLEPPIIHRDIKPQNVVVDDEGVCHLIDMGISRIYSSQKDEDTVVMGTRGTMPPEQFGYQQTDQRSDIYSVGVLLLYCLTGDYNADDNALSEIDSDLREIIRKATQFDPNMRYQTAREMMDTLLSVRYGAISPRSAATAKKRGALTAILAAAVVLLCLSAYPAIKLFSTRAAENARNEILANQNEIYEFKEPLVEAAVRLVLQKEEGDITLKELESIDGLGIIGNQPILIYSDPIMYEEDGLTPINEDYLVSGAYLECGDITSLEDLKHMPNLQTLGIFNQKLSDISELREFTKLIDLRIGNCPIEDFSPLRDHPGISSLALVYLDFDDASIPASLPNLVRLDMTYTNVSDVSALAECRIQSLSVTGCPIKDLSFTADLGWMYELSMTYDVKVIERMQGCPTMQLTLTYEDNISFAGLNYFPYLESLYIKCLSDNCYVHIPEGMYLPSVNRLRFDGGSLALEDFSEFKALPRLTELCFSYTEVQGFKGLDELSLLRVIHCNDEAKGAINALYPDNKWEITY